MEIEEKKVVAKQASWKAIEAFQFSKSKLEQVVQAGEYAPPLPSPCSWCRCGNSSSSRWSALKWTLLVLVGLTAMAAGAYVVWVTDIKKQETEAEYGVGGEDHVIHIAYMATP
jgi:hypothetical protein